MGTLVIALFWAHVYSAVLHMGRDVDVISPRSCRFTEVSKYLRTAGSSGASAERAERARGDCRFPARRSRLSVHAADSPAGQRPDSGISHAISVGSVYRVVGAGR
jgi:hypothetical protein